MLNDIIFLELSISKMITQSPSLVSMYDTLVNTTTLENVFLNVIWSQYLMTNKAIKWSIPWKQSIDLPQIQSLEGIYT